MYPPPLTCSLQVNDSSSLINDLQPHLAKKFEVKEQGDIFHAKLLKCTLKWQIQPETG